MLRQMPLVYVSVENKGTWWSVVAKPSKFTFSKATRRIKSNEVIPLLWFCIFGSQMQILSCEGRSKKWIYSQSTQNTSSLVEGEDNSTIRKVIGVKRTKRIVCLLLPFKPVMTIYSVANGTVCMHNTTVFEIDWRQEDRGDEVIHLVSDNQEDDEMKKEKISKAAMNL